MRRRDRELNIFSMSALDLFASAMGAFILITLVLMPYYLKSTPVPPVPTPEVCPDPAPVKICPICPRPSPAPPCPKPTEVIKLKDNLLVIEMEWHKRVDMDLYVTTPDGTFSFQKRTISGKPGKLTLDDQKGGSGSLEIWKSYAPTPGTYNVCYELHHFAGDAAPIEVKGRLDKPSGPVEFPKKTFSREKQKLCPIKFKIKPDYSYEEISRG